MSAFIVRPASPADRGAIRVVNERAFDRAGEADLVARIVDDGDAVLELVAERDGAILGHVLFSRLSVVGADGTVAAVALAPLAVDPARQGAGVGAELVREAHLRLRDAGETLSVVLGDPAYYGRFGYAHARAAGFECEYQCEALQALAWADAPETGRLAYPRAFGGL